MPDAMSFAEGALIEPYCVGNHAVELAGLPPGSSAAVLGCGTIGMMTIVSLVNHGAGRIIGSDISDFKKEFTKKLGTSFAYNPVKDDVTADIMRITDGIGVDAVFVTVAVPDILDQAFTICRKAGRIIIVALFDEPVSVDLKHIQRGQRYVIGTTMYTHED
jgi:threonine dehydrogenase-like Zn-dependent dehydrogenase